MEDINDNNSVTIKNISNILRIAPSTVSRALQGKKGVSESLRKKIIATADDIGYQPNKIAQSLRLQTSNVVGVIIPDNSNPFFSAVLKGIEGVMRQQGYTLLIINTDNDPDIEKNALLSMTEMRIAGILAVPSDCSNYERLNVPLIFLTRCQNLDSSFNYIISDDVEGAYLATKHLIQRNLNAYFYLCDSLSVFSSKNRFLGYQKALEEFKIPLRDEWVIAGNYTISDYYKLFQEIAGRNAPPFGILCHNDYVSIGLLKSILDAGYKVKEDVHLIGYDDIELISYLTPRISTVSQSKFDMGSWGAKHLINMIQANKTAPLTPLHIVTKPELIIRET